MITSIQIVSSGTYAKLVTPEKDMSVLIPRGLPTVQGLREHAADLRKRAIRLLQDADYVELGAHEFEKALPTALK